MKIVLSHPTANANVRAILNGFLTNEVLHSFHTSIASFPNNIWDTLSKLSAFKEFNRRAFDKNLAPLTTMYPLKEVGRMVSNKVGLSLFTQHEVGQFSVDAIYKYHDKKVANALNKRKKVTHVYGYEDGVLETFKVAKQLGIKCIYDLPIAYWATGRQLMQEEAERLPAWANTMVGGIKDSQQKLDRKTQELELADSIVVASKFVKDSLPELKINQQVIMSPFGSPQSIIPINFTSKATNKPLRVLFAGSMGQRKGLADLLQACSLLNTTAIELVIMGSLIEPLSFYQSFYPNLVYEPSRPHQDVLALMRSCDVFCLPSIVEGRALVMQEAMSQGLPIIITPNTGGEDLVIDNTTGFLIPIRSPEKIAAVLEWCLENRAAVVAMGHNAMLHAQTYTWKAYVNGIINSII
jgi:glycosyltransferase involved in cell wall biosynthesis